LESNFYFFSDLASAIFKNSRQFFRLLFLGADFSDLANGSIFHTKQHYICPQSHRLFNIVWTYANIVGESVAGKCLGAGSSLLLAS